MRSVRVGFVGGGSMASAICRGVLSAKLLEPQNVWVGGPRLSSLEHFERDGVHVTDDCGLLVRECSVVFLCVKPHVLDEAVAGCCGGGAAVECADRLFVSVLAGVTVATLERALAVFPRARVVRTMPNTPMLIGHGASVYAPGTTATPADCEIVERVLRCCGLYERVPEALIDAMGALAGSGPAFVYSAIEAFADGAVEQGVPRKTAIEFAAQTFLGAAKMVLDTGKHPGQLKDEVCSAGGSTIRGVHALERGGMRGLYMDAIAACVARSKEIGRQNCNE